ncbi:related to TY3B TY3B protein [Armillaria ostoyae]|uniref:Related to TY3B TY3B protein n=1 Tax=Armillaria ostoyae TaxID=47428 RepID=A0A284RVJ2_ARMOS|nr:related to TY3B TY3B protein [Armillaria ostoyae]
MATPKISIISAAAFVRACAEDGAQQYTLQPSVPSISGMVSSMAPPDMSDVPAEYHDFADVFSDSLSEKLPEHRPYDLKINLEEGTSPPLGPIYSLSESELKALREFIDNNLRSGFITPSRSPHGAPVLFVKKKTGELRLCVDFRGLNKISKKDCYPLPLISDLLDSVRSTRIYTKLDLRHAYHLVRIAEGDEWKTAFRTRYGSFEWRVMPFGLTNAPAAFQRFVNDIFADMLDVSVVVYLDDILIYSNNPADHWKHVREVLCRLRANQLYCKGSKCEFHRDSMEYLGYILSPEGLCMSEDKVKAILDWPVPRKVKDIQSFLGFTNFYRRFIHEYSDIVIPLTRLTRKGTPWKFDNKCMAAFNELKQAFTHAPILTHWVPDRQLVMETDASDYAIAAILSIYLEDGEIHPIAFLSCSLHNAELNYDTHDKELLAIFEAFKYWHHYLEGSADSIDVVTDYKNLEYFSTTKVLTRRQVRWSDYLPIQPKGDSQYAAVNPHNFWPVFTQEQLSASLRATFLEGPTLRASAIMDIDKLHSDIKQAQPSDSAASKGLRQAKSSTPTSPSWWSIDESDILRLDNRIYVPDSEGLRLRVLQNNHDHILAGHFGQNRTLELV